MPLQNRVDPYAAIHADPARGTFMGNRGGCFHTTDRTLKRTHWKSRQWIICRLDFKGRKRELMAPGKYTELFFLDEATALAAGHRPCFECRREEARAFKDALVQAGVLDKSASVADIDGLIAGEVQERLRGKAMAEFAQADALPDGAIFDWDGGAWLKLGDRCLPWSFEGYRRPVTAPTVSVKVLTPHATLGALAAGYEPDIHLSADRN
ncbi:hypothetical protein D1224_15625 [Henriciella barbarensis]|uniref:Uncharacterized protein n=2 Tax=Henriciella barbarensis TaxID=86342 RepID=A0A399QSJ5_9PROT|nr:hypothetical protein D1224_15625 [Henriciella barbarensis]